MKKDEFVMLVYPLKQQVIFVRSGTLIIQRLFLIRTYERFKPNTTRALVLIVHMPLRALTIIRLEGLGRFVRSY